MVQGGPDEVRMSEDGKVEIWWDRSVKTTRKLEHNHPDITVLDQVARRWTLLISRCHGIKT